MKEAPFSNHDAGGLAVWANSAPPLTVAARRGCVTCLWILGAVTLAGASILVGLLTGAAAEFRGMF